MLQAGMGNMMHDMHAVPHFLGCNAWPVQQIMVACGEHVKAFMRDTLNT